MSPSPIVFRALLSLLALGLCGITPLAAAPLAHRGSVVVSGEWEPRWSSLTVMPALGRSTGVGPALNWMVPDDEPGAEPSEPSADRELWSLITLTQRLHRWNGDHYQANLWAGVGAGLLTTFPRQGSGREGELGNRAAWSPWTQLDWETRRLYLGANVRWFQAADTSRLMTSARAGVALTEADYNRWQPWLMVEARTMEGLQEGVEITPLLRLLHRRWLAEVGVSTRGDVRVGLTYTF